MKEVLYLTRQGSKACYRDGEIVVECAGEKGARYSSQTIKAIYIFGNVELSSRLMNLIMRKGIDCVFMTIDGRFKGRVQNQNLRLVKLRRAQYAMSVGGRDRQLEIARTIVGAKIRNQRALLLRYNRKPDPVVSGACVKLRKFREGICRISESEMLMGVEGIAGRYYWQAFRKLLKKDLGFTERAMHPPPDPVNAALSFGYTLLYNEIANIFQIEGLDIYLGVFHATEDRRASLALDLMEEFRTPVVDYPVLRMFNLKMLTAADFEEIEKGVKVYLSGEGRTKLIFNFRERLQAEISDAGHRNPVKIINLIKRQVMCYKAFVRGENDYKGYEWSE